jgi:dGTPase
MAWLRREDLEDRELRELAPVATKARDHGGRRVAEPEDPLRTAFQRDRDRVLHSAAFRRLQGKTQVLAAYEGDHQRTRLTHSLEVCQLARSVASALRLNADLCEAVALAHDLGHPPFGHVGEEALDELMAGHGGFRHNAHGARIVDWLEDRYGHGHGLNLTLCVRRSLLKGNVPAGFPLAPDLLPKQPPPLEAHVVDLCDKIAYLAHDVDDGIRIGLLAREDVARCELWRRAAAAGADSVPRVVSEMISVLVHDLVAASDAQLTDSLREGRPPRIEHSGEVAVASAELLAFLREHFYRSRRVLEVMHAGRDRIRAVFARFVARPEELPAHARGRIVTDGVPRAVCDYVAGMTDRFLVKSSGA